MMPRLRPLPGMLALLLAGPLSAGLLLPGLARAAEETPTPTPAPASPAAPAPALVPVPVAASGKPVLETFHAPAPLRGRIWIDALPPLTPAGAAVQVQTDALAAAAVADHPTTEAAAAPPAFSIRRGEEVFARIRGGLGSKVCEAGGSSERWRRRYASNPAAFASRLEQILPLLDFVSVEVQRAGLPSEFTFIPLVESWYKPEAMGVGGPAGMWQMIGSTARNHGIHIQPGYDGRLSPVESTRAALSYLKVLHGMFGDWEATVMAYNAGEGRLLQAFKRARNRDADGDRRRPHGLSNITYDYVAKLQALSCLVDQPERNNLHLPRVSRFVPLTPVLMEPAVADLGQFAQRQGRNPDELRRLNPGYRGGRVVAGVPRLVLMPLGAAQAGPAATPAALASAQTGPQGGALTADTLALAMLVAAPGPVASAQGPVQAAAATNAAAVVGDAEVAPVAPEGAMVEVADVAPATMHRVVAGESLWTIARLHALSIDQLRVLNRLDRRAVVHPGQTLKLAP